MNEIDYEGNSENEDLSLKKGGKPTIIETTNKKSFPLGSAHTYREKSSDHKTLINPMEDG